MGDALAQVFYLQSFLVHLVSNDLQNLSQTDHLAFGNSEYWVERVLEYWEVLKKVEVLVEVEEVNEVVHLVFHLLDESL